MSRLTKWLISLASILLLPSSGLVAGVVIAFGYTYVFLDEDRTGNADIGTNMAFFGIAVVLGIIGIIAGLIAAGEVHNRLFPGSLWMSAAHRRATKVEG